MEELSELESRLTRDGNASLGQLDEISRLYQHCESADLRLVAESLRAIGRVLAHHRRRLAAEVARGEDSASVSALGTWLSKHANTFHTTLRKLATCSNARAEVCAIRLVMEALHSEDRELRDSSWSRSAGQVVQPAQPAQRLQDLVQALLLAPKWSDQACDCISSEFVQDYVDVRHCLLQELGSCCREVSQEEAARRGGAFEPAKRRRSSRSSGAAEAFSTRLRAAGLAPQDLFSRVFALLRDAPPPAPEDRDQDRDREPGELGEAGELGRLELQGRRALAPGSRPLGFFGRQYPGVFRDAWLALLGLPVPLGQCRELLQLLPERVMPCLPRPLVLADFYLRAFHGDSLEVSVLSLSGLLLLLTKHGLGDPETLSSSCDAFYEQLYALFSPKTFALRRRARFQRLAVGALSSGLLPARFAAVFAKKCLRLALACSEPGSVMWLMSLAYTLIQKHHSHCKFLLHRPLEEGKEEPDRYSMDPFESSASLTSALEQISRTSLWELQTLQRHYLPAVSVLAKLFVRPFFKPSARKLDPELFLDQSIEKSYRQALRAGERQLTKWKARSDQCPMAFRVEENAAADNVVRLAALLSTSQRKLGAQG